MKFSWLIFFTGLCTSWFSAILTSYWLWSTAATSAQEKGAVCGGLVGALVGSLVALYYAKQG